MVLRVYTLLKQVPSPVLENKSFYAVIIAVLAPIFDVSEQTLTTLKALTTHIKPISGKHTKVSCLKYFRGEAYIFLGIQEHL